MPRPRTKGEPIQIRLPLDLDQAIRYMAEIRCETPSAYVTRLLVERIKIGSRSDNALRHAGR